MANLDNYKTLILNADSSPIAVISWKRAICLVMEGRIVQLEFYHDVDARDGRGRAHPIPAVACLKRYVRRSFDRAPFCRKNILIRDLCTCQYCGGVFRPGELTLDHVTPRSKWTGQGTPTCWENVVACCVPCNRRKGDRTCEQARMPPMRKPAKPRHGEVFLGLSPFRDRIAGEWLPYLQHLPLFRAARPDENSILKEVSTA